MNTIDRVDYAEAGANLARAMAQAGEAARTAAKQWARIVDDLPKEARRHTS